MIKINNKNKCSTFFPHEPKLVKELTRWSLFQSQATPLQNHVGGSVYFEVLTSIKYGFNGIPDLLKNASVASN